MATTVRLLIERGLRSLLSPSAKTESSIYLALSGGVDSSVAGFLLKEKGWEVKPVLMRCWDDDTAEDNITPCHEAEMKAASSAVRALGLQSELQVFDFVQEYWAEVFDGVFLSGLRDGKTPNPDLACNRSIKFGAFPSRLKHLTGSASVPRFATGHYARLRVNGSNVPATLLCAADQRKDQSYFLSSVSGAALSSAIFPVGQLLKSEVREIATFAGLPAAKARSSRGICFVGKRQMTHFLERYMPSSEGGHFIDVDSGGIVARLPTGPFAYTIGQRARIGGLQSDAMYVVGRRGEDLLVAAGREHPRLYACSIECPSVDWVAGSPPLDLLDGQNLELEFKANSVAERKKCFVRKEGKGVHIAFEKRERLIAAGQAIVLYAGEVCLGAAWPSAADLEFGRGRTSAKAARYTSQGLG